MPRQEQNQLPRAFRWAQISRVTGTDSHAKPASSRSPTTGCLHRLRKRPIA